MQILNRHLTGILQLLFYCLKISFKYPKRTRQQITDYNKINVFFFLNSYEKEKPTFSEKLNAILFFLVVLLAFSHSFCLRSIFFDHKQLKKWPLYLIICLLFKNNKKIVKIVQNSFWQLVNLFWLLFVAIAKKNRLQNIESFSTDRGSGRLMFFWLQN